MLGSLLRRPDRRAHRAARPSAAYAIETLENRVVLSAASPRAAAAAAAAQADVSADVSLDTPLLEITGIAVNSLQLVDNQLTANANIVGNLLGQEFNLENVDIPLEILNVTEGEDGCPILDLAIGPIDLNLLGLDIELDDCEGGPVTLQITAIPGGGLLGDLLCGVANLLNDQGLPLNLDNFLDGLNDVLGDLTDEQLAGVGDLLEGLLNGVLGGTTLGGIGGGDLSALQTPGNGNGQGGGSCDILTLEIPEGINLTLLGLNVQTSGICLDIDAERGPGNLLGNLLCTVTNLLNSPASLNAVFAQVNRLGNLLDRL